MSEPAILDAALLRRFPLPHHAEDGDKEDRGRLLVIAGSRELPGAALLAGTGALRAGAGKLQIATVQSIAAPLDVAMPEARAIPCEETGEGCIAETAIGSLADRAGALNAWKGGAIMLPHAGEMARLLGCDKDDVSSDPLASARTASERFGAVAVLKGQYSHIVAPDGQFFRFEGGGIGLATSGSGDVLAGIVGGLCARGADPLTAALWGVHLHGEAGRRLTVSVGRVGFLARELADLVPRIIGGGA